MILIDKSLSQQRLIITTTERNIASGNILKLKAENKQDNKQYELTLPANTSQYQDRYDEYIFPTSDIHEWKEGTYIYNVVEYNGSTEIQIAEIGLLKVTDIQPEQFISIQENDTNDDFITYDNI